MTLNVKNRLVLLASAACLVFASTGCGGGEDGQAGADGTDGHSVSIVDLEPGTDC